ncbi:hypothetical protein ACHRVW_09000 [Flavobacterium collinsii]|uniref:hypothetical protein n=1 Tax=Flavobacterium collinsii TaxID=1114861 RepID=UPI00375796A4
MSKHILFPIIIAFLCLIFLIYKREEVIYKTNKNLFIAFLIFFITYLIVVGSALFHNIFNEINLNKYDLNNDGIFSGEEITADQLKASEALIRDSAGSFSFVTGLIYAFLVSFFLYLILLAKNGLRRR